MQASSALKSPKQPNPLFWWISVDFAKRISSELAWTSGSPRTMHPGKKSPLQDFEVLELHLGSPVTLTPQIVLPTILYAQVLLSYLYPSQRYILRFSNEEGLVAGGGNLWQVFALTHRVINFFDVFCLVWGNPKSRECSSQSRFSRCRPPWSIPDCPCSVQNVPTVSRTTSWYF